MTILTMALLASLSLGLMIAGIQMMRFQKQLTEQRNLIKKTWSELNANSNGSIGLGHRQFALEKFPAVCVPNFRRILHPAPAAPFRPVGLLHHPDLKGKGFPASQRASSI